jgi:hypothetical protein
MGLISSMLTILPPFEDEFPMNGDAPPLGSWRIPFGPPPPPPYGSCCRCCGFWDG